MELKHIDKIFSNLFHLCLEMTSRVQAKYYQIFLILIIEAFLALVISIFEKIENK